MRLVHKLLFSSSVAAMTTAATVALAEPGYVSGRTGLRAGPGVRFPVVATMRGGDSVEILGCLSGWRWCDIVWRGARGWAPGSSLEVFFERRRAPILRFGGRAGVPFVGFSVDTYWGEHYRDRPFYNQIPRFGGRRDGDVRDGGGMERREDRRMDDRRDRPNVQPDRQRAPENARPPFGGRMERQEPAGGGRGPAGREERQSPPDRQAPPAARSNGQPFGGAVQPAPTPQPAPQRNGRPRPEDENKNTEGRERRPFGGGN